MRQAGRYTEEEQVERLYQNASGLSVAYPPPRRTHNLRLPTRSDRVRRHPETPENCHRRATARPWRADHRHYRRVKPHGVLLAVQATGSLVSSARRHPFRMQPRTKEILFTVRERRRMDPRLSPRVGKWTTGGRDGPSTVVNYYVVC